MWNILKILLFLGLALVLVWLAMLNADGRVSLVWFPGQQLPTVPVFVVILGSMFAGVLVAGLVSLVDQARLRRSRRRLEQEVTALRTEVRELRNLPIDSDHQHPPAPTAGVSV